jgi:predicted RNase H-like HicB family nuclease
VRSKKYGYRIELDWSPDDDAYVVRVSELEGCITHGDSPEKALAMAEDAIDAYIASLRKHGQKIPEPLASRKHNQTYI